MRPHGNADVDAARPRAWGICQRCGFLYNHDRLAWQYEWGGLRLINLRILVCPTCKDEPQIQLRTLILPPDPTPIEYAVPEDYVGANNPLSAIGVSAQTDFGVQTLGAPIGTLTGVAGLAAAFDGNLDKPSWRSAVYQPPVFPGLTLTTSSGAILTSSGGSPLVVGSSFTHDSSFGAFIGVNWTEYPRGSFPSSIDTPVITHTLGSYSITGPSDTIINSSGYVVQGSNVNSTAWASWTTLASGGFANTAGESVTGTATAATRYQYHRVAFSPGVTLTTSSGSVLTTPEGIPIMVGFTGPVTIAQVQFFVTDGSST